ncbi:MAG: amino acid ABC transporter substrate-binding protein [Gammaproteobacteria bacterium]|nr:amino acid ABC transporter substrate-binding protein [Gammaproteobacteria bacterium]
MKLFNTLAVSAAVALASTSGVANAGTLQDVKARGELNCVVTTGVAGFAAPNDQGRWEGFDVDFCRATAAAVLGDPNKVKFVPTTGKTRFTVLNSGEGDILYRNTTITMSRDADLKLTFLGVNYYDGQGFMVPKALGVTSAKQLDGASVCIQTGTTTELNLADYFRANNMSYEPVTIETNEEGQTNYLAGRCDVYTTDASGLAATRSTFDNPNAHVILPEIISKEPLGPAVRQGDDEWADTTRWVLNMLIEAEEFGLTQANVKQHAAKAGDNPSINRMVGTEGDFGSMIGLDKQWAVRAISAVGNYGEIFERNIGVNTPLGLSRGLNAQWTKGGILYSPPLR